MKEVVISIVSIYKPKRSIAIIHLNSAVYKIIPNLDSV